MIADAVAAVLVAAITLYAVLAGADFGGGLWDLLAGSARQGARPRALIDQAISPVWEANHVWLIVVLVVLWTAFPVAFGAIFTVLFVPLSAAAFGIVLRGAGFAFRKTIRRLPLRALTGGVFAVSSLVTPFFLGSAIGAIVTGRVVPGQTGDPLGAWTNVTSLLTGGLFVACGAYLAAAFLAVEAGHSQAPDLLAYFTRRALVAGAGTGVLSALTMAALRTTAPGLFANLTTGWGLPLVVISVLAGLAVLVLLWRRTTGAARPVAAVAVAAVVWGWAVAQYPYLLPPALTVSAGAAPTGALVVELIVVGIIALVVAPSLALLFVLAQRGRLREEEHIRGGSGRHAPSAGIRATGTTPSINYPRPASRIAALTVGILVAVTLLRDRRRASDRPSGGRRG